jgi:hypothetical protein
VIELLKDVHFSLEGFEETLSNVRVCLLKDLDSPVGSLGVLTKLDLGCDSTTKSLSHVIFSDFGWHYLFLLLIINCFTVSNVF